MKTQREKLGFTLAEVLITLGIIGVVAALTLPNLITNYQKNVRVTQLKKTVSTLEQGFQKLLADEGVDKLIDLPEMYTYNATCDSSDPEIHCREMFKLFKKYFNWEYENFDSDKDKVINFSDGSQISSFSFNTYADYYECLSSECNEIKLLGGNMCSEFMSELEIDVNGNKSPNKMGVDRFMFAMSGEGKLYPFYGKDWALFQTLGEKPIETNDLYWRNRDDVCPPKFDTYKGGNGCAARIIENGWKIDY